MKVKFVLEVELDKENYIWDGEMEEDITASKLMGRLKDSLIDGDIYLGSNNVKSVEITE